MGGGGLKRGPQSEAGGDVTGATGLLLALLQPVCIWLGYASPSGPTPPSTGVVKQEANDDKIFSDDESSGDDKAPKVGPAARPPSARPQP